MTFLNSPLLIGLGLAAIPVILHLLMKQKPKKLIFPALMLLEQRRRQSVRRLRMKHFWLLLLRVIVIVLIVLAVARPSLPPADYRLSTLETTLLLLLAVVGIGSYQFLSRRLRRTVPALAQREPRQSRLRNLTTASTLLAIAGLVGCPYQQRISGELTNPRPITEVNLPVAGIMLFDTSLSMSYLQEGKTALDRAREIARAHIQSLPTGSRIAVGDNAIDNPILFQATMLSAQTRIDSLNIQPVALPWDDRLQVALRAHQEDRTRTLSDQENLPPEARKDRYIRRIYLFTDLAKSGWRERVSELLARQLTEAASVNLYLVDVGQQTPQNVALTQVQLSRELVPTGGDLIVLASLQATGGDIAEQIVELRLFNSQGQLAKVGQQTVSLDDGVPMQIAFPPLSDLKTRVLQGEVRLASSDPLTFDNVRHFSAEVIPAPKVLVVGPRDDDVNEWMLALAPNEDLDAGRNKFLPEYVPIGQFQEKRLSDYAAVTLINCRGFRDDQWQELGKYVENGGGLIIVLGDTDQRIDVVNYNRAQAQVFLPAELVAWQPDNNWRFQVNNRNHPLFWKFRQLENYGTFATLENIVRVRRFWTVTPAEEANIIATYTDRDRSPALVERSFGRGRTVVLTTDASNPDDRDRWSTLASPFDAGWVFVAFVEQLVEYVSRFTDIEHNFIAGQRPVLPIPATNNERQVLIRTPDLKQSRMLITPNQTSVVLEPATQTGHYSLFEQNSRNPLRGFSVNAPAAQSDLTRFLKEELDARLGEGRYEVSTSIDELKDTINAADIGQEVFPMLLMLVVVCFLGEHLVANWFYAQNDQTVSK